MVLTVAAGSGLRTATLTIFPPSCLAQQADIARYTSVPEGPSPGDAVLPRMVQVSLSDTLCVALFIRDSAAAVANAERIEQALKRQKARKKDASITVDAYRSRRCQGSQPGRSLTRWRRRAC